MALLRLLAPPPDSLRSRFPISSPSTGGTPPSRSSSPFTSWGISSQDDLRRALPFLFAAVPRDPHGRFGAPGGRRGRGVPLARLGPPGRASRARRPLGGGARPAPRWARGDHRERPRRRGFGFRRRRPSS